MVNLVEEDAALEPSIHHPPRLGCCTCSCSYRTPSLRELFEKDRRLLRSMLAIVILMNVPVGQYVLYPLLLFATWIHESFHGIAALLIGGDIISLNVYKDGSGLCLTSFPVSNFNRCWVASAGYQGTAVVGGVLLMFRRSNISARIGTCGAGLLMLLTCILYVRNPFGLASLVIMGFLLLILGWKLPPFWVGELFALLASTTCLNAITSIRVLFFVSEAQIGGVVRSSDAVTMQEVTAIHAHVWAGIWLLLSLWATTMGINVTFETASNHDTILAQGGDGEDHPLALTELS
mmetsp:Transcript_8944/g.20556  ORF Transcript_8944/g.20556 Transcript_8944/m.20556 type:complete len:291 (+) Transcript_8944:286-1158(+)